MIKLRLAVGSPGSAPQVLLVEVDGEVEEVPLDYKTVLTVVGALVITQGSA